MDKIRLQIDNSEKTYKLSALDEICLGKSLEEIKEYAKEKNIEIEYKKI